MASTATAFDGGDINVIISNVLDDNWLDSGEVSQDSGEEEGGGSLDSGENASFWKVQRCLVEEFIEVGNSDESKLQQDVIGALKIARSSEFCTCGGGPCTACLKHEVAHLLRVSGYDAALCKSKWRTTKHIPKGKHEYLDLILANGSRLIIELDFRAEFEIARSSQDYHNLVNLLPEVYIGKPTT
ncbi:hypothetical protein AMTR_s00099p00034070 [Amborella trichopoda]|uniref:Uncharacterized protein n=1 Tax=Amborella trichopoda TaxID=13333 RepID=W1NWI7_AMBTC|nr:hypothetical protein AMTR_s00099p00034070 [Amborella trichopoda]